MKHARKVSWVPLVFGLLVSLTMSGCDGGGDDGGVNNAPAPTAPDLVTVAGMPGTSQVVPNDPDAGQTHTFAITTAPATGTATVDAHGLVTYTPAAGFVGATSLVVTVTDDGNPPRSGAVTLTMTINAVPLTVSGIASKGPLVPCAVRVFVLLPDGSRGPRLRETRSPSRS